MVAEVTRGENGPLIAADHLSIVRQGRPILDNVTLAIHPHEFVTVIGPNGAGKTVLLHSLMGFFAADAGSVRRRPGLRIGYMPQRLTPDPALPITAARFLRLVRGATGARIEESLAVAGASALARKPLHVLSGGEMQRVLLARALLHRPDLLVLDEPAQNLDIGGQLGFYRLLETIYQERGCSILMVSHDLHMVMASTSRVLCLFHHVCCTGTPETVTKDPQFAALFGSDMARLMSVYHHAHSHTHAHGEGEADVH
jgi:zinc transport system ATP-binding protein